MQIRFDLNPESTKTTLSRTKQAYEDKEKKAEARTSAQTRFRQD